MMPGSMNPHLYKKRKGGPPICYLSPYLSSHGISIFPRQPDRLPWNLAVVLSLGERSVSKFSDEDFRRPCRRRGPNVRLFVALLLGIILSAGCSLSKSSSPAPPAENASVTYH